MTSPQEDTIVAIVTPPGPGGIGVIRLSGPDALPIADRLFKGEQSLSQTKTHTARHGWIESNGEKLDEVIACVFIAPQSYTGENVVEISCHGSPALLKEVASAAVQRGARWAKPGEFTERAYLNGKMDLIQAEAVAELVSASSSKARRAAASQLEGALSKNLKAFKKDLVDLLAGLEANLDFVEEDIPPFKKEIARDKLNDIQKKLEKILEGVVRGKLARDGVRVAFLGRPNVGKSSLFNAILGSDRAIVTAIAGTTRDVIEESHEWRGFRLVLTDTAGLRETQDKIEAEGTARSRKAADLADVACFVLDGSEPFSKEDRDLILALSDLNLVFAINKADLKEKLSIPEDAKALIKNGIRVSAKSGEGINDLKDALLETLQAQTNLSSTELAITNERHIRELEIIAQKVKSAGDSFRRGKQEEEIAIDLRAALEGFQNLLGEFPNEEVLDSIFRQFCVGK